MFKFITIVFCILYGSIGLSGEGNKQDGSECVDTAHIPLHVLVAPGNTNMHGNVPTPSSSLILKDTGFYHDDDVSVYPDFSTFCPYPM